VTTIETTPATVQADVADSLASRVNRLAAVLAAEHYPGGDRAALKRHAPGQPAPLAFYRLWFRHLNVELPSEAASPAWTLLAWGLASSGPTAHRRDRPLGQCLAECGYAEARLERLLAAADDDMRLTLAASLVRFVAAKRDGFDWVHLAQLLLTRDEEARERLHRRIATDYYRHLPRTDHKE
jgi:CRISPR system Cascade subunit CasB